MEQNLEMNMNIFLWEILSVYISILWNRDSSSVLFITNIINAHFRFYRSSYSLPEGENGFQSLFTESYLETLLHQYFCYNIQRVAPKQNKLAGFPLAAVQGVNPALAPVKAD